jgi:hypothetical protein
MFVDRHGNLLLRQQDVKFASSLIPQENFEVKIPPPAPADLLPAIHKGMYNGGEGWYFDGDMIVSKYIYDCFRPEGDSIR